MAQDDLSLRLKDRAVFLPAISSFYSNYIGRQRHGNYVDPARVPAGFENGIEGMNWLNKKDGYFYYPWSLYSAGHANLDLSQFDAGEDMIRNRDRANTTILGDSGGFQIAKGVWEGEWCDPNGATVLERMTHACEIGYREKIVKKKKKVAEDTPTGTVVKDVITEKTIKVDAVKEYQDRLAAAQKKREVVLKWLDGIADYAMTLDIPTWVTLNKKAAESCGVSTVDDAIAATCYNNEYFIQNRLGVANGGTRFLNVLQGSDHEYSDQWYEAVKHYCDPAVYPGRHFDGWAMGGQNMCDIELVLKRLVTLCHDKLLQSGVHDWIHVLGTSRLEWALLLTDIQRAIRRYHNPTLTISFDCASPFLATAKGQIYHENFYPANSKWGYRMSKAVDDKKYSKDTRIFDQVMTQDGHFDVFEPSPISQRITVGDVCYYQAGDLNKIGKEGKTSWDSFSYALQMGHNVYAHLNSVLTANERYDAGTAPNMLDQQVYDHVQFTTIVDSIFSAPTLQEALDIIKYHSNGYWLKIRGTRGSSGKQAIKSKSTTFFEYNQFNDDE